SPRRSSIPLHRRERHLTPIPFLRPGSATLVYRYYSTFRCRPTSQQPPITLAALRPNPTIRTNSILALTVTSGRATAYLDATPISGTMTSLYRLYLTEAEQLLRALSAIKFCAATPFRPSMT